MAKTFYQPGEQRAARVRDLFTAIASRYDLINDLQSFGLHRLWKRRLVTLAGASSETRVLDLCCGTGDLAMLFARCGAQVVGVDFSESMLTVARRRQDKEGHSIAWLNADALALPFADSQFDVVSISYGLRNLADLEKGLREMQRVAAPGGRLLVLDFGKPQPRLLRAAYFGYLRYWVPVFGRLLCGDPATYSYILESLRQYPGQEKVAALMGQLGCEEVRVYNLLAGMMSINYARKAG